MRGLTTLCLALFIQILNVQVCNASTLKEKTLLSNQDSEFVFSRNKYDVHYLIYHFSEKKSENFKSHDVYLSLENCYAQSTITSSIDRVLDKVWRVER